MRLQKNIYKFISLQPRTNEELAKYFALRPEYKEIIDKLAEAKKISYGTSKQGNKVWFAVKG